MLQIWFRSPLPGSVARRLGLVSRFREPEAAITSRLGRLALLPNYQLDLGAPAPTASAEASMNRTNLDCFGVASGGLLERSGWTCLNLSSYISNRSQAVATRFRFMLMNFYWLGQVRAGLSDRPDRIRRPSDRSRSRAGSLWRPPRMALLFSLRTSRPTDQRASRIA